MFVMKNRNFIKNSILLLLPISMGIGVLFGTANRHVNSASAYTKDGILPTTIDLRDNSAEEIENYYSGLSSLSSSELQGNNLLKNLKPILKNGQKYFAYDGNSGDDLWKMYEIIDRDWEKSPASAITGYSSSTNKITGYTYGTSTSNKGTNPYIHALYVDRNVDNQTRAWDDHQQTQWGINREHIWPKSQGFNAEGAGGARGDPMHLWAGNGRVNGTEHNNNMYGFVDKSKSYTNPYDAKSFKNLKDNYSGKSLTIPTSTDTVFEPQDCDKGDIARAIFYMVARYNNIAGNDTIDTNNPNLALKQTTQSLSSYTTTSSNKQTGYMGLMTDLLYWNHLDPVDEFEIHRNNLLFNNYTHNRNPFIDYPEWADYIWGKPVYNGRNYISYSSTPTGSVNLSTDVINGFKGEQPVQDTVTSIEITKKPTKLVYNSGETLDTAGMEVKAHLSNNTTRILSASDYTVTPSGTLKTTDTQATITYEGKSASFAIAVKSSGGSTTTTAAVDTVLLEESFTDFKADDTPTKNGTSTTVYNNATVTYRCDDGGSATKIYNAALAGGTSPEILISKNNGSFVISNVPTGNAAEMTLTYKSNNANNSVSTTSTDYSVSGSPKNYTFSLKSGCTAPATISISIDNSNGSNTRVDDIKLVVKTAGTSGSTNVDVSSITLNKNSTTMQIGTSEQLSATISPGDATIKLVSWSSSNSEIVEVSDEGEITAKSAGNATITCAALDGSGVTATCTITVSAPVTLQSITLSGQYPTEFYLGDTFSSDGLIVTANYSDNTHIDVTDDVEIIGYDMESESLQTVTVSYGDKTASYTIEVKEKSLAENEILIVASQQGLVNADDLGTYTDGIATVSFIKNNGTQPKYYSSTSAFRVYCKNTFTIVGTKTIQKIEFEMNNTDKNGTSTITSNVGSFNGTVWTGQANNITFTIGGDSGQRNIVSIKITYNLEAEEIVSLQSISLSGTYKTEYFAGDTFTYEGLIVIAHYSDETSKEVTPTTVSSPTMSTAGQKTISVSYTEDEITRETTYLINVTAIATEYITLSGNYKTTFIQGEEYDSSGLRITEHYNNGGTSAAHYSTSQGCTITGYDKDEIGEQTINVDWNGVYTTYTVNVIARPSAKVAEEGEEAWYLVNNLNQLEVGGIYTIASIDKGKVALPRGENSYFPTDANTKTTNASFENNKLIPGENVTPVELTLGGSTGQWTLLDDVGYVATSAAKAFSKDGTNTWKISFDDDYAVIESTKSGCGSIQYNAQSPRFVNYSSSQTKVSLFRYYSKTEVTSYVASVDLTKALMSAKSILDAACSAKNVTTTNWRSVKNLISPFLSDTTSDDYKALMFGEAKSAELDGNMLEDFLARYDLITKTYGYENFIKNGDESRDAGYNKVSLFNLEENTSTLIIAAITGVGILAIGCYFFFERRKEEF